MSTDAATNRAPLGLLRRTKLAVRSADWTQRSAANGWEPVLAYGLPVLLAVVAVQFWFRNGGELAGGDLVPPIYPGADYLAHWNDVADGAGSPGYSIVSLPYFEGLRAFHWLGLGDALFQRVWLTLLLAGAAAAVVFLTRSLFRSTLAGAVAGLVSVFNGYRLVMTFNAVPLAAMIAAGVLGGLVLRSARAEQSPHPLFFAVASVTLGFVFVNPPHVVLVLAWLVVCSLLGWVLNGRPALARTGRFLVKAAPLALLFNLWWIVPAYLTLTGSVFAQQFTAPGVGQWAWTHQRASIPNVLSLTSSWAWLRPEYYPFSAALERLPFNVLKYVPAGAAALGVLLARGRARRAAYLLATIGLAAIWMMKGLHPPFGRANLWLYHHVPGFWLFREPMKVGLILVLVFSLLAALAVVELGRRSVVASAIGAAVIVAAVVAYAHPLLTGRMIADKRPLLPPAHVRLPSAWRQAASYVDARPEQGKAVVLPELDYYQAPTTWGYYGASFFHQLFHRPVIEPLPGGYYSDPVVSQLVGQLQQELLDGRDNVRPVLRALGARFVLLRRDLDTRFPGRSFVAPGGLARALVRADGLRRLRSFGLVDVYEATGALAPEVYPAVPLSARGTTAARPYVPLNFGANAALVAPNTTSVLSGIAAGEARLLPVRRGAVTGSVSLGKQQNTAVKFDGRGGRIAIQFPRLSAALRIAVGQQHFIVSAGRPATRTLPITAAKVPTEYQFLPTDRIRPIPIRPRLARGLGDCNQYDTRTASQVGLSATVLDQAGTPTLLLGARDHAACVAIPIRGLRPAVPFRLRLAYRGITGNAPRLCIWEQGPNRCAMLPSLLAARGWHRFGARVTLVPGTKSSWLFLYADGGASEPTVTAYRSLRIESPQAAIAVGVLPVAHLPQVTYRRVAPYEFRVHVRDAREPFLLVLSETFASGWHLEGGSRGSARASHLRVDGYANGWRVPWRGSYDLELTYGPEQLALWTRRGDALLIPVVLALSLLRWGAQRRPQRVGRRSSADSRRRLRPRTIALGWRTEHTEASTMRARLSMRRVSLDDSSAELRKTNEELTTKLKRAEDALANYRERETLIAETLLTAQNAANELRERTERDLAQRRAEAEELRRRAEQSRAELASEVEWLRTMRAQMQESIRSLLLNTLDVLGGGSRAEDTEREPSLTDALDSRTLGSAQPSAQDEKE
jgi:arabinofuranan 3-O-arabinosyltransferase